MALFLASPVLTFSFTSLSLLPLSLPSLLLPVWALYSRSRHTGQIWIVLMYLNRHTRWEKPLLLTTACSQWADIGVSFCDWDLARSFGWDSRPSLLASSVLSSHTCTHSYLLSSDKPWLSLLSWFRCGGSLVADIKVRIKCLPCNHLFMVEWKLLVFHTLFTTRCTPISHSKYNALASSTSGLQPCMWLNTQHPKEYTLGVFYGFL